MLTFYLFPQHEPAEQLPNISKRKASFDRVLATNRNDGMPLELKRTGRHCVLRPASLSRKRLRHDSCGRGCACPIVGCSRLLKVLCKCSLQHSRLQVSMYYPPLPPTPPLSSSAGVSASAFSVSPRSCTLLPRVCSHHHPRLTCSSTAACCLVLETNFMGELILLLLPRRPPPPHKSSFFCALPDWNLETASSVAVGGF